MAAEIAEQPESLARLLADTSDITDAVARIKAFNPRMVLLAARGTSNNAALYFKYLLEISLGLPVGMISPSTFTVYGKRPDLEGVLWVTVSQSGGSADLVEPTAIARECGALTIAVTNNPTSPLNEVAEIGIDILAGPELAVAATKTYTSQLLALWLLVDHWRGGDGSAAAPLADFARQALAAPGIDHVTQSYRYANGMLTTGRGYSYPTAREAALKLMETSYVTAQTFSGADLMHGPLAVVDPQTPVIAIVSEGAGGAALLPSLERLVERGADITLFGDPSAVPGVTTAIELPQGIGEELAPIVEILPLQRLAHRLAVIRHLNPDEPRGLAKVTSTR
jgi:glucosamine--fructose-6-phosphate aminotransferase (isomerizing)